MNTRSPSLSSILLLLSLAGASLPAQTSLLPTLPLARDVNAALGLRGSHVVNVALHGRTGERQMAALDLGLLLELSPHSVRSPNFRVFSRRAGGRLVLEPRGKARTVQGRVVGIAQSHVAGSVLDDGLHAKLWLPTGEFWIEPVARHLPRAPAGTHVLYRSADVIGKRGGCGSDLLARVAPRILPLPGVGGGNQSPDSTNVAELACDADFEYYSDYGTVTATTDRIENVIGIVNVQYVRDLDVTHEITDIFVQTVSGPPYTSTDATALLYEFRGHWIANHTMVQRDIAQLFTGKNLDGATIGTAWVGVVCDSSLGYGLVQSDSNINLACVTDLSAHELGHNWNADHCQCSGYTMNPLITCGNRFHPTSSIEEMKRYIKRVKCLGSGGGNGTSLHVSSITVSTQGNKRLRGQAVVKIVDDLGNSVEGATVTGDFTGTFNETGLSGTTNSSGEATILTSGATKSAVSVQFCVTDVTGALVYIAGNNLETCDNN